VIATGGERYCSDQNEAPEQSLTYRHPAIMAASGTGRPTGFSGERLRAGPAESEGRSVAVRERGRAPLPPTRTTPIAAPARGTRGDRWNGSHEEGPNSASPGTFRLFAAPCGHRRSTGFPWHRAPLRSASPPGGPLDHDRPGPSPRLRGHGAQGDPGRCPHLDAVVRHVRDFAAMLHDRIFARAEFPDRRHSRSVMAGRYRRDGPADRASAPGKIIVIEVSTSRQGPVMVCVAGSPLADRWR